MKVNKHFVSVHGGHSGEFCHHAKDDLKSIITRYEQSGFKWVGITEHMPPVEDRFAYDDERDAGLSADQLKLRFHRYMETLLALKDAVKDDLTVYAAFETEYYTGAIPFIKKLIGQYQPDYVLGSIHHIKNINFDYSEKHYEEARLVCKGKDNMYIQYFEEQYELLYHIKPAVVGHFDLIRLYDNDYKSRIRQKEIMKKIERNLEFIAQNDLILDFNLRALKKGADEPYITYYVLMMAKEMGIRVMPGDDSHSVKDVGNYMDKAEKILHDYGFDTEWKNPFE